MLNRETFALVLATIPADKKGDIFKAFRPADRTLDNSYRGQGNASARRQGIDTSRTGCDCDVCVVYGGDCSYQIWRENHSDWHRAQRGVKTKASHNIFLQPDGTVIYRCRGCSGWTQYTDRICERCTEGGITSAQLDFEGRGQR